MKKWILTHEGDRLNTDHICRFFVKRESGTYTIYAEMCYETEIEITYMQSMEDVNEWFGTHLGV